MTFRIDVCWQGGASKRASAPCQHTSHPHQERDRSGEYGRGRGSGSGVGGVTRRAGTDEHTFPLPLFPISSTCGEAQFSLLAVMFGAPAGMQRGAIVVVRAAAQSGETEASSCVPSTHLLFEHRGHTARQLESESTPRGQRVPVAHARGVQSLVWGQG